MEDFLAHIHDDDLVAPAELQGTAREPGSHEERLELFRYDRYDWSYPLERDFAVLRLRSRRGDYFACVSPDQLELVLRFPKPWFLQVQYNKNEYGEPTTIKAVYAFTYTLRNGKRRYYTLHRVVTKARKGTIVDHGNHMGLDCRNGNLKVTTVSGNHLNMGHRTRPRYPDLPMGVIVWSLSRKTKMPLNYKGKISFSHRGTLRVLLSKRSYEDPGRAARWYRLARRLLFKIHHEGIGGESYLPLFPPLATKQKYLNEVHFHTDLPF